MHTLLHASPGGVVLQVEQVLHVLGYRGVEVRGLEVRHDLKTLLSYGVLLIPNREKSDRQCCCSGKVCHHLNGGVELATDDESLPWVHGDEGYCHADFAHIQAMGHRQATVVDRNVPVIAEMKECVI
jgi:hypothetical protein